MNNLITIILTSVLALIAVISALFWFFRNRRLELRQIKYMRFEQERLKDALREEVWSRSTERKSQIGSTAKRIEDIIEEKKRKFLDTPSISFHFADKDQIRSFYDDYFKEPTLESLVSEITGEVSGQVKASLPQVIESKIGGKDVSKWISTIRLPDMSLAGMFLRYQRETIKSGQVTLGVEEVDIELTELQDFEEAIQEFDKQFDLKLDQLVLDNTRTHLKQKAAEKTLVKLEQATDYLTE